MLAKQIVAVSLLGLFFSNSVFGQGFSNSSSKPKTKSEREAAPTTTRPRADSPEKPDTESVQHGDLQAVALTDARGVKRVVAETVDRNGKKTVYLFVNSQGSQFRRSKSDPSKWDEFDKSGERMGSFYGNVELVDGRDIRVTKTAFNQVSLFRLDGSWEWELSTQDVLPRGDERQPKSRKRYTVRSGTDHVTELIDHEVGHTYSTSPFHETDLLKRDSKTGTLSFVDWKGYLVTIETRDDPDTSYSEYGKCTRRSKAGVGAGYETDAGGRLIREFDSNNKTKTQYEYQYSEGRAALYKFRNSKGTFQKFDRGDGREWWGLVGVGVPEKNGIPTRGFSADAVCVNRDNDLVVEDGKKTTVHRTDGSSITVTITRTDEGSTERTVAVADSKGKTAYSVTEVTASDDSVKSRELVRAAGRFRTTDGSTWHRYDESGNRIEGSRQYGSVDIADGPMVRGGIRIESGSLIKTAFVSTSSAGEDTEPLGESAPDSELGSPGKLVLDEQGRPIFKEESVIYTNGFAVQRFAHGGTICRYPGGDILYTIDAAHRKIRMHYEMKDGKRGPIEALEMSDARTGKPLSNRKWNENEGCFVDEYDEMYFTGVRLTKAGALVEETPNEYEQLNVVTRHLDGKCSVKDYDGSFVLRDRMGRMILERAAYGLEMHLEYDPASGDITRIDLPAASIVLDTYQPDATRPLRSNRKVFRADRIHVDGGFGFRWFGHYKGSPSGPDGRPLPRPTVRFVQDRNGQRVIMRLGSDGLETEHVVYNDVPRLLRATDASGHMLTIHRDADGNAVRADGRPRESTSQNNDEAKSADSEVLGHNFTVVTSDYRDAKRELPEGARVATGGLTVTADRDDGNRVAYDDASGARVTLWADGGEERLQDGKLVYACDAWGRETRLTFGENGRLESVKSPPFELKRDSAGAVQIVHRIDGRTEEIPLFNFSVIRVGPRHTVKVVPRQGDVVADYYHLALGRIESRFQNGFIRRYEPWDGGTDKVNHENIESFAKQHGWRGKVTYEIDAASNAFQYFYWDNGERTRVGIRGTKQDIDAAGRITYEKFQDGRERYVTYGKGASRRESYSDGSINDFNEQDKVIYERDAAGNEVEHFYLDNGHHVARRPRTKDADAPNDGKKIYSTTTFEPDPTDVSRERMIHHQTSQGREFFVHYNPKENAERRDDRVASYIVGNEKNAEGRPADSLVEFDRHGRMTYRREASGADATFYYGKTSSKLLAPRDNVPIVVEDSTGKWVRGERLWDGARNYRWKVTRNGRVFERTGTFDVARFRQEALFKTTDEPEYAFVALPNRKPMLDEDKHERDLGNGLQVVRHQNDQEIFVIHRRDGEPLRFVEAPADAKLQPGVQAVDTLRLHEDGSLEIFHHDGRIDRRSPFGPTLHFNSKGNPDSVSTRSGWSCTTGRSGQGQQVKGIQVDDRGIVNINCTNGEMVTFDHAGNRLRYAGLAGDRGPLKKTTSADGSSSLKTVAAKDGRPLRSVRRLSRDVQGKEHTTSFHSDANGTWTDGTSTYDALWVNADTGIVTMVNDTTWREIHADGSETEKRYTSAVWVPERYSSPRPLLSELSRDALGQVKRVTDAQKTLIGFVRNREQELVAILEGVASLVREPDGKWVYSQFPNNRIRANVEIEFDGTQRWSGDNGTSRTRAIDGKVAVRRADGSSLTIMPGGTQTIHRHGPSSPVEEVTAHEDGSVAMTMKDGSTYAYNPNVRPDECRHFDTQHNERSTFPGVIGVSANGTVTITAFPARKSDAGPWKPTIPAGAKATILARNSPVGKFTYVANSSGTAWSNGHGFQVAELNGFGAADPRDTLARNDPMRHGVIDHALTRGLDEMTELTLPRMADRLGVSQRWLQAQANSGAVPAAKEGDEYYFDPAAVDAALAQRITEPPPARTTLAKVERIEPSDLARLAGPLFDMDHLSAPGKSDGFAGTRWRTYRKNVPTGVVTLKPDGTVEMPGLPASLKKTWKSPDGRTITIEIQHPFLGMTLEGKRVDANTLQGEASDRNGKWEWTAKRLMKGNQATITKPTVSPPKDPSHAPKDNPSATNQQPASSIDEQPGTPANRKNPVLLRAEQGDPAAQFQIGREHFRKRELDEAKKWFEKSAAQGFRPAQEFLKRIR